MKVRLASFLLGLRPRLLVALHALNELLPALGMADVLDSDIDALLDVAVSDNLVDDNTNGMRSDVVYNASAPMVEFMGHTLLLGGIGLDVDNIANAVVHKERRQLDRAMFCNNTYFSISSPI